MLYTYRYIKKVVLGLFGRMVTHLNITARVQMAHTLGGQDVVTGKVEGVGLKLKDQVIFLITEMGTAEYIFYIDAKGIDEGLRDCPT